MNHLAAGRLDMNDRTIDLANVDAPVLVVAGTNDVLAPADAVVAVEGLLTGAPEVRVVRAPGGHLGVLTGRGAKNHTWRHLDDFLAAHDVPSDVVRRATLEARERELALAS
jgi:polyhydroxyalkanoate synthase